MTRPSDWSPLAGSDPVPGDPYQVERTAKRYADTAREIATQADALRRLAGAEGWDAEAAVVFRDKAGDAEAKLRDVHTRYETAGSALGSYVSPLEDAQRLSLHALDEAKAAERDQQTAAASAPTSAPGADATPAQHDAYDAAKTRSKSAGTAAGDRMTAARNDLTRAVDDRDHAAERASKQIREAIDHDGLKDSRWEKFKAWVHDNADWISAIGDILGYIATALLVISLFIPGVNFFTAAIILTSLALTAHTLLASTGNGSWVDVGLDVFALVTMGAGKFLTSGAKAGQAAARTAASRQAARVATGEARAGNSAVRTALGRQLASRTTSTAGRGGTRTALDALNQANRAAGRTAARGVTRAPLPTTNIAHRVLAGGEDDLAKMFLDVRAIGRGPFGSAPRVAEAVSSGQSAVLHAAVPYSAGAATDVVNTFGGFDWAKDMPVTTREIGSTW